MGGGGRAPGRGRAAGGNMAEADIVAAKHEYDGRTALHLAARRGHKDLVALLLDRIVGAMIAATDKYGSDGVTFGGGEWAQGRGRVALGKDGGRRRRRERRRLGMDGVAFGGIEWAQGRGRAAVGKDGGRRRRREGQLWKDGVTSGGDGWAQGRGRAAA